MWMRWNDSTHIFEQSFNDGASWAVLPLNASVINEGAINIARLPANLAVKDANNNFSVGQTITGGLTVTSGGITVGGNAIISGVVSVTNNGESLFSGAFNGDVSFKLVNTQAGVTARATLLIGNNTLPYLTALVSNSSTIGTGIFGGALANGSELHSFGSGGLTVVTDTAAPIRFFTNLGLRATILHTGEVLINQLGDVGGGMIALALDGTAHTGVAIQDLAAANNGTLVFFLNSANGGAGYIGHTGATTVAYNTSSDARLKTDKGQVKDLSALRKLIIHDFEWKEDKIQDRGVFAQEAHKYYPRAVFPPNKHLDLWVTDYSKLVPDLIAGWQEHDKRISELEAKLNG